jgi:TonB family protein
MPPPPPPPPPPEVAKVLPKEPAPLPKPTEAKPKPEVVKPEPKPKVEPEPEPEQNYEDVLANLRKDAGETEPTPVEEPPKALPSGPAGGPGVVVDPATARWMREVKIQVTRAWILAAGFKTEALITDVMVDISASGDVLGTRITKGSGNPWYDESVERAIQKASPLLPPPEAREWQFTFDSRDM